MRPFIVYLNGSFLFTGVHFSLVKTVSVQEFYHQQSLTLKTQFSIMISGKNFVGFEQKASGQKKLHAFSTVQKNDLPGEFSIATEEEIQEAISKATSAFE